MPRHYRARSVLGRRPSHSAKTVVELLRTAAERYPDADAFRAKPAGSVTFARLWTAVESASSRLAATFAPETLVGLVYSTGQWDSFTVSYLAAQLARLTPVPLSPALTARELSDVSSNLPLQAYLSVDARPAVGLPHYSLTDRQDATPTMGGQCGRMPSPDDVAHIIFTSGSTGASKGVVASHRGILETTGGPPATWQRKTIFHSMPPWTAAGCEGALILQLRGAMTAVVPDADPWRAVELLEVERPEVLYLAPAFAGALLKTEALSGDTARFVTFILLGGAAPAPKLLEQLQRAFPAARIVSLYGLTEAGGSQIVMAYDPARPGAAGRPTARAALRIVDSAGRQCEAGKIGEIWLRQERRVMRAYYDDRAASAAVFGEGWVKTGDLGRIDVDGYLYITGRIKETIIVGGQNVSACEVEAVLARDAEIREAAVIGVPDAYVGEAIAAYVVLKRPASVAEIRARCRGQLSPHKVPRWIIAVPKLPRSELGKVRKATLCEWWASGNVAAGEAADAER